MASTTRIKRVEGVFEYPCPPAVDLSLTSFDEALPSLLVPQLFIFKAPPGQSKQQVSEILKEGVREMTKEIPLLAVDVVTVPTEQKKDQSDRYHPRPAALRFTIQDKSRDYAYAPMKESNFSDTFLPSGAFDADPMPEDQAEVVPMCNMTATFINGGLIICAAINHTFGDALSYNVVMRSLAKHCVAAASYKFPPANLSARAQDRKLLAELVPDEPKGKVPWSLKPVSPLDESTMKSGTPSQSKTQIFRIPPSSLKALKASASPRTGCEDGTQWISTHDAVCAFLFRTVMRARHRTGVIREDDNLLLSVSIDIRPHLKGLPEDWLGNGVSALRISLPAHEALAKDGLSRIAQKIRASVAHVGNADVRDYYAHAKCIPGLNFLDNEISRASAKTAVQLTSWRKFAYAEVEWPEELGKYQGLRFPGKWQPSGWFVIFPDLEDGTWEICVTNDAALLDMCGDDEEFRRFATVAWSS